MAITKIMAIGLGNAGKASTHLKNALNYIMNEAKTDSGALVGGWNCLPEFAFEQMVGTKELYGKTGGRQGYHFVVSCPKGEGTPEQLFEIMGEFAQEFLGNGYEAAYSAHTDKDHCHGHLVFNSVNMNTGRKYEYKKGDWKHLIQPITNRLCEAHGLSIMPAEYSREPVNMERKGWEKEKSWSGIIEADVRYCRGVADDYGHFLYLLGQLGYEVKQGVHLAVKAGKMKRFRRLDTIEDEYSRENLEAFFANKTFAYETPKVMTPDIEFLKKPGNPYQQKFYAKIYRMRVVEKCRFQYHSTRFKEDLERMRQLQEEYLFLCRKDIKGMGDICQVIVLNEYKLNRLSEKQKMLYRERRSQYRMCIDEDKRIEFLQSEPAYRKQLEEIRQEKKGIKAEIQVADRCLKENLYVGLLVPEDVEIGNVYDIYVPQKPRYFQKPDIPMSSDGSREEALSTVRNEVRGNCPAEDIEAITDIDLVNTIEKYGQKSRDVTKEVYEAMTDKEKIEWIGIDSNDVYGSMRRFHQKLESLGMSYRYSSDESEEFCRLEEISRGKPVGIAYQYKQKNR